MNNFDHGVTDSNSKAILLSIEFVLKEKLLKEQSLGQIDEFSFYFDKEQAIKVIKVFGFIINSRQIVCYNKNEGFIDGKFVEVNDALKLLKHDDAKNALRKLLNKVKWVWKVMIFY